MDQLIPILRQYWGYESFRPLQSEAMACVMADRDSIVVLPTGGGKSLCFQVPAVAKPGFAVVVSPLISLMKDQVDALTQCGVPAVVVNSSLPPQEQAAAIAKVKSNGCKLLYVAPERLNTPAFITLLRGLPISFFAIDEAHCISSWGHDFRPDYRQLSILRKKFPDTAIHAYTATATKRVRDDIAKELSLADPAVHVGAFDRPNLIYRVEKRTRKWEQILAVIDRHPNESGIIYCISRRNVDDLCDSLCEAGYRARPYHAGLDDPTRKANQEAFIREDVDIIVATVAFGMGIDKSNVRYVIHAAVPKSIEHYQQESGRAGRDGLASECVLLWGAADFAMWRRIMESLEPEAQRIARAKLNEVSGFCSSTTCRHRALVNYFGQEFAAESCGACDICLGDAEPVADALTVAQKILSCVVRIGEPRSPAYTARVLTGSEDQHIATNGHDKLTTYGILSGEQRADVRAWIEQLTDQRCLEPGGDPKSLVITEKGWRVIRGAESPRLVRPRQAARPAAAAVAVAADPHEHALFDELRALRKVIANERGVPAFVVFSDATLLDMARRRPTTAATFRKVSGVGDTKSHEFAARFLPVIAGFCRQRELPTDLEIAARAPRAVIRRTDFDPDMSKAKRAAMRLFREGKPLDQVAREIGRAHSTTAQYLEDYITAEGIISPRPWVDNDTFRRIRDAVSVCGMERLKPIFDHLEEKVEYGIIRIAVACLRNATPQTATYVNDRPSA